MEDKRPQGDYTHKSFATFRKIEFFVVVLCGSVMAAHYFGYVAIALRRILEGQFAIWAMVLLAITFVAELFFSVLVRRSLLKSGNLNDEGARSLLPADYIWTATGGAGGAYGLVLYFITEGNPLSFLFVAAGFVVLLRR